MNSTTKRHGCLSIFLIVIMFANLLVGAFFLYNLVTGADSTAANSWTLPFSIAICFGNVICAVGVWNWWRWGVVGYAGLSTISYFVSAFATGNWFNLVGLAGAAILVAMILPAWKQMAWGFSRRS